MNTLTNHESSWIMTFKYSSSIRAGFTDSGRHPNWLVPNDFTQTFR
jgi:hypothetical protein